MVTVVDFCLPRHPSQPSKRLLCYFSERLSDWAKVNLCGCVGDPGPWLAVPCLPLPARAWPGQALLSASPLAFARFALQTWGLGPEEQKPLQLARRAAGAGAVLPPLGGLQLVPPAGGHRTVPASRHELQVQAQQPLPFLLSMFLEEDVGLLLGLSGRPRPGCEPGHLHSPPHSASPASPGPEPGALLWVPRTSRVPLYRRQCLLNPLL